MVTGVLALGHETVCLCPLGSVHSCCCSVSSLWRTCCHPGGWVWVWRSRSSLRGYCFGAVVLWFLATFYRFCVVAERDLGWPGPARLDITLLPTWRLVLRPCFLVRRLPSVSFPGVGPVGGSCMSPHFEMLSVLFPGNIGSHFLGISRSFLGNVWFLLFLELLASSCPGSYGREGGSAGLCLHPPAFVAPDPQRLSG